MTFENFLRGRRRGELSPEDLGCLEGAVGELRTLAPRKTFINKGEPVGVSTYLIDGFICRYMDDRDGERQLVAVHVPGDFVDLHAFPLKHLDHDITTLTKCRVALVPHAKLNEIVASRPNLTRLLWFSTLLDAAMHREWIFRLGRLDAAARLGHFMCEMDAKLRVVGLSDGKTFALPMTQMDLGEACGLTPVHVNRMLRELRERNLLEFRGGKVSITNMAALAQLSEFDPSYLFLDKETPNRITPAG